MKGVTGLIIAALMAVAGGVCNWLYIEGQANQYRKIGFVAVAADEIRVGDKFKREHFEKVDIPAKNLGNIENVAVKWVDLETILDQISTRRYASGQMVLQEDLKTPPARPLNEMIGPDEIVMWLPVDPRSFNPGHVNPGDVVSFRVPSRLKTLPTQPGQVKPDQVPDGAIPRDEIIGPFRILALGNRRGSSEVAKAAGIRAGAENVIAIGVKLTANGLEKTAARISELLAQTNFKGVQVLLHSAKKVE